MTLNSPRSAPHILAAFAGHGGMEAGLGRSLVAAWGWRTRWEPTQRQLADAAALLLGAGIMPGALWQDVWWGTHRSRDPGEIRHY